MMEMIQCKCIHLYLFISSVVHPINIARPFKKLTFPYTKGMDIKNGKLDKLTMCKHEINMTDIYLSVDFSYC